MKRFALLLSLSVLFFGCNTGSDDNDLISWIVFNKTENDVSFVMDNVDGSCGANDKNYLFKAQYISVSDNPTVKFTKDSTFRHLKAVKDYYYLGSSVIRSLTIKPQEKVSFYVSYLGGTEVFATCKILHKITENNVEKLVDDFITVDVPQADGSVKKYPKKFTLTVGNAPDGNSSGFDGDKVYTAQKVYEEEQPYYIFYTVENSGLATSDDFYNKDYIDTSKAINALAIQAGSERKSGQYLTEYYGSVRRVETLNSYTEYFMLTAADK